MPQFLASAPRINLKVNDIAITAPAPYAAGHTLTDAEAAFFNRQVATAVANPIPKTIKAQLEAKIAAGETPGELNAEALQHFYDTRYAAYVVGASNRGTGEGSAVDPIMSEARKIAAIKVTEILTAKGITVSAAKKSKVQFEGAEVSAFSKFVSQMIAANPGILDTARAQVEAMKAAAADLDFDLSDLEGTAEAPAE